MATRDPTKLTIAALTGEDRAWLGAESGRIGCDPENLVRMMIRQRMAVRPLAIEHVPQRVETAAEQEAPEAEPIAADLELRPSATPMPLD